MRVAAEAPLKHIALNAGLEPGVVVEKVRNLPAGEGLNAATGEYVNMVDSGIIDPAKVTRSALQNAASIAALFLTTEEAGTKPAHREALLSGRFGETVVTRVFSGRAARALRNAFTDRLEVEQISGYPQVHHMTAPLRAASAQDPAGLNLWAGTGFAACRETTATDVVEQFRGL